jgi:hypothetical protein
MRFISRDIPVLTGETKENDENPSVMIAENQTGI